MLVETISAATRKLHCFETFNQDRLIVSSLESRSHYSPSLRGMNSRGLPESRSQSFGVAAGLPGSGEDAGGATWVGRAAGALTESPSPLGLASPCL